MITVELYGIFRLDTGLKGFELDEKSEGVAQVKDLYPILIQKAKEVNPDSAITYKNINGCIIVVNNKQVKKSQKLKNGDKIQLMSPLCGG